MSDVSEHSEFCYLKKEKKGKARWSYDKNLAALGPYAMTSGQIFSRPALPLSQC